MRVGVTGASGRIGKRLVAMGYEPLLCDVRDAKDIRSELQRVKPDIVLHLAAKSDPDFCQENYDDAIAVNVFGTSALCQMAEEIVGKGRVILISTDQVFDGKEGNYTEEAEPNPINNYGLTKLAAEGIIQMYYGKIIRISHCFDSKSKDIAPYLSLLANNIETWFPNHIFRSYTHLDFIAEAFYEYAQRFDEMPRILHLGGAYPLSFYALMSTITSEYGYDVDLISPRGELDGFAPRPANCGLNLNVATILELPIYDIHASIQRMKNERL